MEFHNNVSIREMFILSSLPNNTYGISGYDFPKKYVEFKNNNYNNKNKPNFSTKKRGESNENKKIRVSSPAPNQYAFPSLWSEKKKGKKFSKDVKKNTYIDKIFRENERFNFPGPGSYFKRNAEEKARRTFKKKEMYGVLFK
jgi:hypothetical protein